MGPRRASFTRPLLPALTQPLKASTPTQLPQNFGPSLFASPATSQLQIFPTFICPLATQKNTGNTSPTIEKETV